jgi:single-strand DNA-binding protein
MAGVNKVILVGNLGKDPEVRTLENGSKVASFSLATSENYKDRNTGETITNTEWHNIVMWRGLADVAERFLKKGSQIYLEGKLRSRSYQDKEGVTKYITEIEGKELTMLGKPQGSSDSAPAPTPAQQTSQSNTQKSTPVAENLQGGGEEDDDLPF